MYVCKFIIKIYMHRDPYTAGSIKRFLSSLLPTGIEIVDYCRQNVYKVCWYAFGGRTLT